MQDHRPAQRLADVPAPTLAAIIAALAAFVGASAAAAAHPEQIVVAAAAAGAWIGYHFSGRDSNDILIVRLLLAANLFVFAFATHEQLAVEATVAAFAVVFTLGALRTYLRR